MSLVFLLDVDNTLLDNDCITDDLRDHLVRAVGPERTARYWEIFEQYRHELGYADYLGALQRCRVEDHKSQHLLTVSSFLLDYPFASRLFPRALEVLGWLGTLGQTVILTDGDVVFQPHKIRRSGIAAAVDDRVLVYIHKEQELADIVQRYPADHYVFIDDKVRLLTAFKQAWGSRVTTVFPRQGHYAHDPKVATFPVPDVTVEAIGDLVGRMLG
jgi:FMN phosphatase YigB (HAD superfamily)